MTNPLFAKKPMQMLMEETQESGEHTLRRTLGPIHLTALGIGAIIGAGIFVLSGLGLDDGAHEGEDQGGKNQQLQKEQEVAAELLEGGAGAHVR